MRPAKMQYRRSDRRKPAEWSEELEHDIRCYYEAGESSCALADAFDSNARRVLKAVVRAGGGVRSFSEASRRYHVNHAFFRRINTEEQAYALGFLYADGSVRLAPAPTVQVALKPEDRGHLQKLLDLLEADYVIYDHAVSCSFTITSQQLVHDLCRHAVVPAKSRIAVPPELPPRLARHFWRGVFDGDGCISPDVRLINLVGTLSTVQVFQSVCQEIVPASRALVHCVRKQRHTWQYNLSGVFGLAVLDELYRDARIALDRKVALWEEYRMVVSRMRRPRRLGSACGVSTLLGIRYNERTERT
jgi:hypothetical protein